MAQAEEEQRSNRVIISVLGLDRVGIIAPVASILAENNINILDISQTTLQEYFAMVLIADLGKSSIDLDTLKEKLIEKGEQLGVRIDAQHENVFNFMHRI